MEDHQPYNHALEQLLQTMDRQTELYAELVELKEAECKAIVDVDLDALDACNHRQDRIHVDLQIAEKHRLEQALLLGPSRDPCAPPTVDDVCRRLDEPSAERLRASAAALKQVTDRVRETNDRNRAMIRQSLDFIGEAVRVIAGFADGDDYTAKGKPPQRHRGPVAIDKRV